MSATLDLLVLAALLGSGLVAGIFFAFSNFVMRALGQLPASQGIAAMKAINETVLNPGFFLLFLGTGAVSLPLVFLSALNGINPVLLLTGAGLYVVGCVLVTGVFNVPLNQRLAATNPDRPEDDAIWAHYLSRWLFWNHVRTIASAAAAAAFAVALWRGL